MIIRIILILACAISGAAIAFYSSAPDSLYLIFEAIGGFIIGLLIALLSYKSRTRISQIIIENNCRWRGRDGHQVIDPWH